MDFQRTTPNCSEQTASTWIIPTMREFSVCVFSFSRSSNSAKLLVGDKDCEEKKVSEHLGLLYSGKAF